VSSDIPDIHQSIPRRDATEATPAQLRAAGLTTAHYALNHDVDRDGLAELLQMLDVIPTVPGARPDLLGRHGRRKT
jgi:hypothetical protein